MPTEGSELRFSSGNPITFQFQESTPDIKEVNIRKVKNGFIVNVGCVVAVFNSQKEMMKEINDYWKDPAKAEKKWTK